MALTQQTTELIQRVVQLCGQEHTVNGLSKLSGLSERQVYRHLRSALELGLIHCPVRGVYYPAQARVVSFEEYALSNVRNLNVEMSETEQHNKTITSHDRDGMNSEVHIEQRLHGNSMSLQETVTLILTTAQLDYSEFDFHYAMRVLKDGAWWRINAENVESFIMETGRRFEIQAEAGAVKRHAIGYFMGILKRVLSEDTKIVMRSYRQFVAQRAELVAGAEEVAAYIEFEAPSLAQEALQATAANFANFVPEPHEKALRDVPADWLRVQTIIREIADRRAPYRVPDADIRAAINGMEDSGVFPERAEVALRHLQTFDVVGASYFVSHLRHPSRVFDAIRKNYMRYLNHELRQKGTDNGSNNAKDERYSAFYRLFPDT